MSAGGATLPPGSPTRPCAALRLQWPEARQFEGKLTELVEHAPPLRLAPAGDTGSASGRVVAIVAKLAGGEEIAVAAILNGVGAMRCGQGDAATGARVRVTMASIASPAMVEGAFAGAFTAAAGALEADARAYVFPIRRVAAAIFRPDRQASRPASASAQR